MPSCSSTGRAKSLTRNLSQKLRGRRYTKPEMVDTPFVLAGVVVFMGRLGRTKVFNGAAVADDDYFAAHLYKGLRRSPRDHAGDDVRGHLSCKMTLILCPISYVTLSLQTL